MRLQFILERGRVNGVVDKGLPMADVPRLHLKA
jgi:hypothetical protein